MKVSTPLHSHIRRLAVSLALALLVGAWGGGGSSACAGGGGGGGGHTIGLGSTVAPNTNSGCAAHPLAQDGNQLPNLFFPCAGLAGSCPALTVSPQDPGVPGPGVGTAASIRAGATTGRMRYVRMRNLQPT